MTVISEAQALAGRPISRPRSVLRQVVALFKLRIVMMLVLAAIGGAFLAADGRPGWRDLGALIVAGTAGSAGASALNQYFERARDALMTRTRSRRPLATGEIAPAGRVLAAGIALVLAGSGLGWLHRPALGAFVALGAFIYVVVYTLWLKPRTRLNIVIGGLAGSCAVLGGSAAVGDAAAPGALLLAALLFAWTPTHFWSLAIVYRDDYVQAGIPMLPVHVSARAAAAWCLVHSLAVAACGLGLAAVAPLSPWYLLPVLPATGLLVACGLRLLAAPDRKTAFAAFHASNLYLLLVLVAACVAAAAQRG